MTQEELQALLAQLAPNNDPRRLAFTESTETVEREERPKDPATGQEQTWAEPVKKKVPVRVLQWVDPGTGMRLTVQADPTTGTYTKTFQGIDPKAQGEPATTPAQQAAAAGASKRTPVEGKPGIYEVTTKQQQPDGSMAEETHYENESGARVPTPTAPPQVVPATLNTTSPQYATIGPDGTPVWRPNPNYQNPKPEPISLPPTQKHVIWQNPDGTTRTERNPNYKPESKITQDSSGRWIQITEDEKGDPVILPVTSKTTIKPAELPVLQTRYGEIASSLGTLAQDLNSRMARGEITAEERSEAWKAGYGQAQTAVSEINSILDNSRAIWSGEITQRGQSLSETASRRGFAGDIFRQAAGTGQAIAVSSGPGHGKAIAAGVGALMNMGQRYAEGMGGFRESPEVGLPPALQQARGIGLPGFGPAGAPGTAAPPGGPPAVAPGAVIIPAGAPIPSPPSGAAPAAAAGALGATDTTDIGGGPRVMTPGGATRPGAPIPGPAAAPPAAGPPPSGGFTPLNQLPPSGPVTPLNQFPTGGGFEPQGGVPGVPPQLAAMQQQLMGGQGFGGLPVAAGGAGVFDPMAEAESMLSASTDPNRPTDPDWEMAVRQAVAQFGGRF